MSLVTFFLLVVETSNFRHFKKPLNENFLETKLFILHSFIHRNMF